MLGAWAEVATAFNAALQVLDPTLRSERHRLAGGWLVLDGAGMYVNRAIAAGIEPCLRAADIDLVIERCASVGVDPAVEVTALTADESLTLLRATGFVPDAHARTAFVWPVRAALPDPRPDVIVRSVAPASLPDWQHVSALGWGHVDPADRRAADVFARAAFDVDGGGMVIAFDAADGRPLGCASLTRRGGVATLGGMSTIPAERGRGVQAALVRHRLAMAVASGCEVIAASATTGGASERNLVRLGFEPVDTLYTYVIYRPSARHDPQDI